MLGQAVTGRMAEGPLRSLIVDGVIAGLGSVLVFLPQILILFFFIGITPTGLMMRVSGKDPMGRTFKKKSATSYWTKPTPHADGHRHFDRQF